MILAAPLVLSSLASWSQRAAALTEVKEAVIRPDLAPDQSRYEAADPDLRDAAALLQKVATLLLQGAVCRACAPAVSESF